LKEKIIWKSLNVASYCLHQDFSFDLVERSEIVRQHHPLTAQRINAPLDTFDYLARQ